MADGTVCVVGEEFCGTGVDETGGVVTMSGIKGGVLEIINTAVGVGFVIIGSFCIDAVVDVDWASPCGGSYFPLDSEVSRCKIGR